MGRDIQLPSAPEIGKDTFTCCTDPTGKCMDICRYHTFFACGRPAAKCQYQHEVELAWMEELKQRAYTDKHFERHYQSNPLKDTSHE